jgi:tripartite-type tricarboxylate transporter receptor subunit TctC
LAILVGLTGMGAEHAAADEEVAAFYRGKTLTMIVGTAPGAAYDVVARTVMQHMARHIPGQPSVVIQNMPGAASLIMVNHLYNRAPRDGSAMGLALSSILLEQRLQVYTGTGSNVQFDLARIEWVGSPARQPNVMWTWVTTPIKTFADLRAAPSRFGATSPSADSAVIPALANRLLGTRIGAITGYKAIADIFVAAERGEIDGNATPLSSLTGGRPDDFRAGKMRILAQFGTARHALLKDVPTGLELSPDDQARRILDLFALKFEATFPMMLPPHVPPGRVQALRKAFAETMQDEAFRSQAARSGFDPDPMSGEEIVTLIGKIGAADDASVAAIADTIKPAGAAKK